MIEFNSQDNERPQQNGTEFIDQAKEAFASGNYCKAVDLFKKAFIENSTDSHLVHLYGLSLWYTGNRQYGIQMINRSIELCGVVDRYHYNLGTVYYLSGNFGAAVDCYRKVLELNPDHVQALSNLSSLLVLSGRSSDAERMCRHAISINDDLAEIYSNLGNALREQGRVSEALQAYECALKRNPSLIEASSNFLLTQCYDPFRGPEAVFDAHVKWGRKFPVPVYPTIIHKNRPIRVGYVSADFRDHAVAHFMLPILLNHNSQRFEVYCYSNSIYRDFITEQFVNTSVWRNIFGISDKDCAEIIRNDEIDVLIDLSGHTSGNRMGLFALKAAPLQGTYLGYPNTTGLQTVDFRLTDEMADPADQDQFYTERLIRLPHGFLCYMPFESELRVDNPPCSNEDYISFGSFNNLLKMNETVFLLWANLLKKIPNSRLLLKNRGLVDENNQRRIIAFFVSKGVSPERLELNGPVSDSKSHQLLYNRVDIALDTFPYSGTTTTFEALWMGVPVVSLIGNRHSGRVGASILTRIGLSGLVAKSPEEYIEICEMLASDRERLKVLRRALRLTILKSDVTNGKLIAGDIETVYENLIKEKIEKSAKE